MSVGKMKRKPKKLAYLLIEREGDSGAKWYPILEQLIAQHHTELKDARIALAWNLTWKADADGRAKLGMCKKASDLDRELAAYDFVIVLRRDFFESVSVTDQQRRALLDHELCHAAVTDDGRGEPITDERGRIVYRIRKHDLEEFREIVERHGTWKKDLEAFAQAIDRARASTGQWSGYRNIRERLRAAGALVPLEAVIAWTEEQRREADVWARVKSELTSRGVELEAAMPAHVEAALPAQPSLVDDQAAEVTH